MLFCLVVAVVCGADGFVQAEELARLKKKVIMKHVPMRRGVPTHDTMARVLGAIDPDQFVSAFAAFMERITGRPAKDIINLDGKTLRGVVGAASTRTSKAVTKQVHIVSAFSALRRVVLGQLRSKSVANEIHAAQELLQILDIAGAVVTGDSAHAFRDTLRIIEERGADAVVAVKRNAPTLHREILRAFVTGKSVTIKTTERTRGRVERRSYEVVPASPATFASGFTTLKSFVRVARSNVSHAAKGQRYGPETYYASSLPPDQAQRIAECIRARWGIENKLHYVLDVTFLEDRSRIRTKNAPENFSRLRHLALGLLSMVKEPRKLSYALKRASALADDRFLERVLRLPAP